jgi:hypothetical protein
VADTKKSSAMIPLIIVGACLFGFGIFQNARPKAPEINTGFVAPPETPAPPPANPRTMQAPDAPPLEKDAAQRAAEADTTTNVSATAASGSELKLSITNAPWLQGIMSGALGNFREGVLGSLKAEQVKGDINCTPVLTKMDKAAFGNVEKVTCTAKDGEQVSAEFDDKGDGEMKVEDANGGVVKVSKNDGDFNIETRNSE